MEKSYSCIRICDGLVYPHWTSVSEVTTEHTPAGYVQVEPITCDEDINCNCTIYARMINEPRCKLLPNEIVYKGDLQYVLRRYCRNSKKKYNEVVIMKDGNKEMDDFVIDAVKKYHSAELKLMLESCDRYAPK